MPTQQKSGAFWTKPLSDVVNAFGNLPKSVQGDALIASSLVVETHAKRNAPVDEGELRRKIQATKRITDRGNRIETAVQANGKLAITWGNLKSD